MDMKKQIEGIIRDIEIEPAWNTGFSGCSERLNDKSVENAIDKIIQIKNLGERSEPPHPLLGGVAPDLKNALIEIELLSDKEFTNFDNLVSCKINLQQIHSIVKVIRHNFA